MKFSRFIAPAFAALFCIGTLFADPMHQQTLLVEAFTTTDQVVRGKSIAGNKEAHQHIDVQIYELDGIQRFEAKLSKDLTVDHARSKQVVLQRIQQLTKVDSAIIQHATIGLAKAMQYGIDRYPAIIFDGKAVVYGVTDIGDAFRRYQQWREGQRQ